MGEAALRTLNRVRLIPETTTRVGNHGNIVDSPGKLSALLFALAAGVPIPYPNASDVFLVLVLATVQGGRHRSWACSSALLCALRAYRHIWKHRIRATASTGAAICRWYSPRGNQRIYTRVCPMDFLLGLVALQAPADPGSTEKEKARANGVSEGTSGSHCRRVYRLLQRIVQHEWHSIPDPASEKWLADFRLRVAHNEPLVPNPLNARAASAPKSYSSDATTTREGDTRSADASLFEDFSSQEEFLLLNKVTSRIVGTHPPLKTCVPVPYKYFLYSWF